MIGCIRSATRHSGRTLLYLFALGLDRRQRDRIVSVVVCCAAILHGMSAKGDSSNTSTQSDANTRNLRTAAKNARESTVPASQFVQGEWPFRSVVRPIVPTGTPHYGLIENPIDAFVNQKLEAAHLKMSARADKLTLLRRVTYDLTGLPP